MAVLGNITQAWEAPVLVFSLCGWCLVGALSAAPSALGWHLMSPAATSHWLGGTVSSRRWVNAFVLKQNRSTLSHFGINLFPNQKVQGDLRERGDWSTWERFEVFLFFFFLWAKSWALNILGRLCGNLKMRFVFQHCWWFTFDSVTNSKKPSVFMKWNSCSRLMLCLFMGF